MFVEDLKQQFIRTGQPIAEHVIAKLNQKLDVKSSSRLSQLMKLANAVTAKGTETTKIIAFLANPHRATLSILPRNSR